MNGLVKQPELAVTQVRFGVLRTLGRECSDPRVFLDCTGLAKQCQIQLRSATAPGTAGPSGSRFA